MKIPIITIVGRPNTGKSTLFNRLAGKRIAIVSDQAGTTRDRIFYKVETPEMDFFLVDTGGLEFGKKESTIENDMAIQAQIAIEEADLILFVAEGTREPTREDAEIAALLRKTEGKTVLLVANKCDGALSGAELAPLYRLGLGEPLPVSALNKTGTPELIDEILKTLKNRHFLIKGSAEYEKAVKDEETGTSIALVGRPNVGKSSLINALVQKEKLIVSPIPGTTRDSTDTLIKNQGRVYNFIDTAGLRRQSKRENGIEHWSALRSMSAIERSDIALLVLDSSEKISQQDQQIGNYILSAGKGLIILANKWDLKPAEEADENEDVQKKEEDRRAKFIQKLQQKFSFTPWAPVIFTSAITRKNLPHIFDQVERVRQEREKRIQTRALNTFTQKIIADHRPTGTKSVRPKLFYITQTDVNPPTFVAFVNKKKYFHFSYIRYLENRLREKFGFNGTPILLEYREKEARYQGE